MPKVQIKIIKLLFSLLHCVWGQLLTAVCSWSEILALKTTIILLYPYTIKHLCLFSFLLFFFFFSFFLFISHISRADYSFLFLHPSQAFPSPPPPPHPTPPPHKKNKKHTQTNLRTKKKKTTPNNTTKRHHRARGAYLALIVTLRQPRII